MSYQIERLAAGDFEELIGFLSAAFKHQPPSWFADNLPAIYQPTDEDMQNNYVVRIDGRIAACVGVFPQCQRIAGSDLPMAGIGGVSVADEHRGKGLMKLLMAYCLQQIKNQGYPLAWLGGQRQRYRHWGYERCGYEIHANFNTDNLRHEPALSNTPQTQLLDVDLNDHTLIKSLHHLHDTQPRHMVRPADRFAHHLREWSAKPRYLPDTNGKPTAYAVIHGDTHIAEIVAKDPSAANTLIANALRQFKNLTVSLDPITPAPVNALIQLCESWRIGDHHNFLVLDWPKTLQLLMQAAHEFSPLAHGQVVISADADMHLSLAVDSNGPRVQPTSQKPHLTAPTPRMHRLLFGPLKPSMIQPLSADATILDQWCPLPMFIGRQDGV